MASPISVLWKLLALVVGLFLVVTIAGGVVGQPMGFSYVETGSMEPQLQPGDGFIAIPTAVAGPVETGDVIVFDAVNLHGGGLVTHRVVGETDGGYVTRGDANPVTDQDGDEPPVQDGQIQAKALQIGGEIVVIPRLGVVVLGIGGFVGSIQQTLAGLFGTRALLGSQGLAYILLGFGTITYVVASLAERSGGKRTRRTRTRTRRVEMMSPLTVIAVMAVVLVLLLSASMLAPGGSQQFQFVSSESDTTGPNVIQQGSSQNLTYRVPSNGPLPVVTIIEPTSQGVTVTPTEQYVSGGGTENVTITLEAPPETGAYTRTIHEYRYLAFLPMGTILTLHAIHPLVPLITINLLIGALFVGVAVTLIGLDPIRINRGQRSIPMRVKLRRWLK